MKKRNKRILLHFCLLNAITFTPLSGVWIEKKAEGWAWYEEEKMNQKEPRDISKTSCATDELAAIKRLLEEKLAEAILRPTDENVASFMHEQKKWIENSADFAKIWAKILLNNPSLDNTVAGFPVSEYGIQVRNTIENEKREKLMKDLTKEYGLFLFYEGGNKVSQAFSKVIKEFTKRYPWETMAISVDKITLSDFKNNKLDNGIAKKLGIDFFPALFLIHPKSHSAVPISYGLSTIDQIENNIARQFEDYEE